MREIRKAYKILFRKPERERPLGKPRHRLEDNIRVGLKETLFDVMDCVHLAQGRDQWWPRVKQDNETWGPMKEMNFVTS